MPIERIPIVHKFGIISHSQRVELQERIFKQSYLETLGSKKIQAATKSPFEVTEVFIQQFNNAQGYDEQQKFEDKAHKMLERIKRKCGLKEAGTGTHVDLPLAWTELSQLAQCKGRIQDQCLDVMILSLDQAPLSKSHIPALFFLAETTLYWLRTDAINQPYLRTGELKLLKMGMLVFSRLFYHHMSGQLQGHEDFKNRLFTYLDGFSDCQDAYSPYPNALLYIRYINEVGRMIIGDSHSEAGEIKEGDNLTSTSTQNKMATTNKVNDSNTVITQPTVMSSNVSDIFNDGNYLINSNTSNSGAISNSVHDLSPTLWHSLDVWRCVRQLSGGLQEALVALGNCGMGLSSESWVDAICAMQVLSDSSKANVQVLKTLQNLARGVPPKLSGDSYADDATLFESSIHKESSVSKVSKLSHAESSKYGLSDIYEKTEYDSSHSKSGDPRQHKTASSETDERSSPSYKELREKNSAAVNRDRGQHSVKPPSTRDSHKHFTRDRTQDTFKTGTTGASHLTTGLSGWKAEAGTTDNTGYGRNSAASSVPTYSNKVSAELAGMHGWKWEVAITYADIMADICLHGTSSSVHKVALLGNNTENSSEFERKSSTSLCPMKSAGLLDLVYFKAIEETNDKGPNDWSWRVRYAAMQGLVKICQCCAGDNTKEGLKTVSWNALMKAHSVERDTRVLEALKVGQVDASIENLITKHLAVAPSTIGAKIAAGLSQLYLPALPKPVASPRPRSEQSQPRVQLQMNRPFRRKPVRTSLKEEIMLATALYEPPVPFEEKTSYDLRRIVEDQWRKELQLILDEDDADREQELKERQLQYEEEERAKEESTKLKKRGGLNKNHSNNRCSVATTASDRKGKNSINMNSNNAFSSLRGSGSKGSANSLITIPTGGSSATGRIG